MIHPTPLTMWRWLVYGLYKDHGKNAEDYDVGCSCIWKDFELGLLDIGYSKGGITKRKRWNETYISEKEVEKFNENVKIIKKKKKDFVALFRFGNKEKSTSNKVGDFCLIAGTFRFQRGILKKVNIYYRTTEGVTKFLADLILLRDFFKIYLTSVNIEEIEVGFWFTKIYTRYFHVITYYRVCRQVWGKEVNHPCGIGNWARELIVSVKNGKRDFKFCAAKRLAKSFKENYDET